MINLDTSSFDSVLGGEVKAEEIRAVSPSSFNVATRFWDSAFEGKNLSNRMKELILIALHASSSSLNNQAIKRHVKRAGVSGASDADILDVLLSIVGLANHALYFAVPVLVQELTAAGVKTASADDPLRSDINEIKEDFVKTRGFWNEQRDQLARLMPDYFKALSALSTEPWKSGALAPKERELIYIAIDCSVTHMHEAGLRMHIRNALKHGASAEEIIETFQLSALMGMESYILGCEAIVER